MSRSKLALIAAMLLSSFILYPQDADAAKFCAQLRGSTAAGHADCSFSTLEKCRARVRHRGGGHCYKLPWNFERRHSCPATGLKVNRLQVLSRDDIRHRHFAAKRIGRADYGCFGDLWLLDTATATWQPLFQTNAGNRRRTGPITQVPGPGSVNSYLNVEPGGIASCVSPAAPSIPLGTRTPCQ